MAKKLIARALQTGLRALTPQGGQALAPQIMTTPPLTAAELKKRLREAPPLVASSMGAAAAWGAQREAFALEILSAPDEQRVLAAAQLALSSVLQSVIATQEDRTLIQHIRVLFACVKSALGFLTVQAEPGVRVEAQAQAAANGMPGALLAISLVSTLVLLVVSCLKLSVLGTALSALSLLSMLLFAAASLRERRQALSRLATRITPDGSGGQALGRAGRAVHAAGRPPFRGARRCAARPAIRAAGARIAQRRAGYRRGRAAVSDAARRARGAVLRGSVRGL